MAVINDIGQEMNTLQGNMKTEATGLDKNSTCEDILIAQQNMANYGAVSNTLGSGAARIIRMTEEASKLR